MIFILNSKQNMSIKHNNNNYGNNANNFTFTLHRSGEVRYNDSRTQRGGEPYIKLTTRQESDYGVKRRVTFIPFNPFRLRISILPLILFCFIQQINVYLRTFAHHLPVLKMTMPFKQANSVSSTLSCLNLAINSCNTRSSLEMAANFSAGVVSGFIPGEKGKDNPG